MKLYFAPMEGITTYTYRNTHAEVFGMCDTYFAPFITPTENERLSLKSLRDLKEENNIIKPMPQVLTNSAKAFLEFADKASSIGFDEVNLNLGCPSGTVVKKGRGAAALKDPDHLERMFDEIFSKVKIKVSVKTRAGFSNHNEFLRLAEIYDKYPFSEIIVHPRVREEYYRGKAKTETFSVIYNKTEKLLCYNGDVYEVSDYNRIKELFPKTLSVMLGRGAVKNPALFRQIKGGESLKTHELINFSHLLEERYIKVLNSEVFTLYKLKEIWVHMMLNFPDEKKIFKALKKANKLSEFDSALNCLPELE